MTPVERRQTLWLRALIVAGILIAWQALAWSGLLFRDVVPSLAAIAAALAKLLGSADFYANLGVTLGEIGIALLIGGAAGLLVGLVRVGRSFRASHWQMTPRIDLPAMRRSIVNGVRLGLGIAIIGTLLAETKLSNRGLGYLVIQAYSLFDMPKMYALLIVLFVIAIAANAIAGRLSRRG